MSGPILAGPSFAELRERPDVARPASAPRGGSCRWRRELGVTFFLVGTAFVGALTVCAFFGVAFSLLTRPPSAILTGAGDRPDRVRLPAVPAASAPATHTGRAPASGPVHLSPTGQPGQLPQPVAAAAALVGGPEARRERAAPSSEPKRLENASAEIVFGPVSEVPDAMTWIVGGQIVHLWGIRPGPRTQSPSLASLVSRIGAGGPINCRRQSHSARYRCLTASGEDVAEMALRAGIGRTANGATIAYRGAEAQARQNGTGMWVRR